MDTSVQKRSKSFSLYFVLEKTNDKVVDVRCMLVKPLGSDAYFAFTCIGDAQHHLLGHIAIFRCSCVYASFSLKIISSAGCRPSKLSWVASSRPF
jgi:hypothetical protein